MEKLETLADLEMYQLTYMKNNDDPASKDVVTGASSTFGNT